LFFLTSADISGIEQASLCVRYVANDQINEKFLMFIPVNDRSGAGLADLIIKTISDIGRDRTYLILKKSLIILCF
jgi:hypothetical protein